VPASPDGRKLRTSLREARRWMAGFRRVGRAQGRRVGLLLALALAAGFGALWPALGAASAARPRADLRVVGPHAARGPGQSRQDAELLRHARAQAREHERRWRLWLHSRAADRQRVGSRTAYRSMSASAVEQLWSARLSRQLARVTEWPQPGFSRKVVRFLSEYKAVVQGPGGHRDIAISTTPLRTSDGRAVSLTLGRSGAGYAPAAAAIPTQIAPSVSQGVSLPSLGVSISMAAAHASVGSLLGRSAVLYPTIATDTDAVITPLPNGVDLSALLRSPSSPQQFDYRLALESGESLRSVGGGAQVLRGGQAAAWIPAPTAVDAQGQPVPVTMSVSGSDLQVHVSHRGRDLAYPITLDPVVQSGVNMTGWQFQSTTPLMTGTSEPSISAAPGSYASSDLASETWTPSAGGYPGYWIAYASGSQATFAEQITTDTPFAVGYQLDCWASSWTVLPFSNLNWFAYQIQPGYSCDRPKSLWFTLGMTEAWNEASPVSLSVGAVYIVVTNQPVSAEPATLPPASDVAGPRSDSNNVPTCNYGAPVNCATGNEWEQDTDLSIPGRGEGLKWARTYNSMFAGASGLDAGNLAPGWSTSYSAHLDIDPTTGNAVVHGDSGGTASFTRNSDGTFSTSPWVTSKLATQSDGSYLYTLANQTREHFSAAGQLQSISDRNAYTTTLSYNGAQLASVTDPAGRSLSMSYNAAGQLASVTDPAGRAVRYGYDSAGNLASVTDVGGKNTSYGYDGSHRLTSSTDPLGNLTATQYDSSGRVSSQTDPAGGTSTFSYEDDSPVYHQTTITDPNGNRTVEQFDGTLLQNRTVAAGTPLQATWRYDYDQASNVVAEHDPNGNTTTATYDHAGNLTSRTDPLHQTTTITYDANNDPLTVTDPTGETTTYAYDPSGNLTDIKRPLAETSQVAETKLAYDPAHPGDLTTVTDPTGVSTSYTYDQYGDLASVTDGAGDRTTYTYDVIGNPLSTISPRGNASGANPSQYTTTIKPDPFGRPLQITDPNGHTTTLAYDADGNRISLTDPDGHQTQYAYSATGQLSNITRADGSTLTYTYDSDGNQTSNTDGLGHTTTYAYDARNELISQTDPLRRTTGYTYDLLGNRLTQTDANQKTTRYAYDAANQLTNITYNDPSTPDVSYSYDGAGRRISMTDGTGTSTYGYDSLGRLTSASTPGPIARLAPSVAYSAGQNLDTILGDSEIVNYGYDLADRVTTITYPRVISDCGTVTTGGSGVSAPVCAIFGSTSVTQNYDSAGRMATITDFNGGHTTYSYDPDGNPTLITYPNSTQAAQTYDPADQLRRTTATGPTGAILDLPYQRDPNGQITTDTATSVTSAVPESYTYNKLNQLTSATIPAAGTTAAPQSYNYDQGDRITTTAQLGIPLSLNYDNANQLTSLTNPASPTTTATFTYDNNGNRVQQAIPSANLQANYTYDQANRLTQYRGPLGGVAANSLSTAGLSTQPAALTDAYYHYNGDGLRADLLWDTTQGTPLILADPTHYYINGPDGLPIEQVSLANTTRYYLHDQLGSTRAITDSHGNTQALYDYDPYGNTIHHTGSITDNPIGYAGQYTDPYSGLIYLRARWYDPATAQFVTRDPLQPITQQAYAYANDDPVNHIDPTGLSSTADWSTAWCLGTGASASGALGAGHWAGALAAGRLHTYSHTFILTGWEAATYGETIRLWLEGNNQTAGLPWYLAFILKNVSAYHVGGLFGLAQDLESAARQVGALGFVALTVNWHYQIVHHRIYGGWWTEVAPVEPFEVGI
jgi:RHS repeat-associated protein